MVICLEQGTDLHMAQLMPLPLTVSCFSKIQIGFTFLETAHPDSPGKRAIKWVCVSTFQILEKQRMDGSWVCYEQLGGWCSCNIPWLDSSPRPPIFRDMGKLPPILPKIWRCPRLASCRNQTANHMKMEKTFFQKRDNCATFWWIICKSPFTHSEKP